MLVRSKLEISVRKDYKKAIEFLSEVPKSDEAFFIKAQTEKAKIYLNYLNDRTTYISVFENLMKESPTNVNSLVKLGDAYLAANEPEKAISYFTTAFNSLSEGEKISNVQLIRKIGSALTMNHYYNEALKLYEKAMAKNAKNTTENVKKNEKLNVELVIEYCNLLKKLKLNANAENLLKTLIESRNSQLSSPNPQNDNRNNQLQQKDLNFLQENVTIFTLLAEIQLQSSPSETQDIKEFLNGALAAMNQVKDDSLKILDLLRSFGASASSGVSADEESAIYLQKKKLGTIVYKIGKIEIRIAASESNTSKSKERTERGISAFKESIFHDPSNEKSMLTLADIYFSRGEFELSKNYCNSLLRMHNQCHEKALCILSNISFISKNVKSEESGEGTIYNEEFEKLLKIVKKKLFSSSPRKKENAFEILTPVIQLYKKAGQLNEAKKLFKELEDFYAKKMKQEKYLEMQQDYCFAKGVFCLATYSYKDALKYFNLLRKSSKFGVQAIYLMIDCYIWPMISNLVHSALFPSISNSTTVLIIEEEKQLAIKSVEMLLKELPNNPSTNKWSSCSNLNLKDIKKVFQSYITILKNSSQDLSSIENAVNSINPKDVKESNDNQDINNLLYLAIIFILKSNNTKSARSLLKQIMKLKPIFDLKTNSSTMTSNESIAESIIFETIFEKTFILLSEIYILKSNNEMAFKLLKMLISENASCGKAWELIGSIQESTSDFSAASKSFEKAWLLSEENNPSFGYKFAVNLMQSGDNLRCVDVCHNILGKYPNYPKLKKEVMDVARRNLRK